MSLYDELQAVTTGIMSEFKQGDVRYVALTPGNGPIDEPGEPTETEYPLQSAVRGAKFRYVQSGLAVATDLQVTCSVPSVVPDMNGFVKVDGVKHKIIGIDPKPAAGTPVAYVLIIRK